MNYELVAWADAERTTHPAATHAKLMWALDDALNAAGIEIPFPQRDLHIRSGKLPVEISRAARRAGSAPAEGQAANQANQAEE